MSTKIPLQQRAASSRSHRSGNLLQSFLQQPMKSSNDSTQQCLQASRHCHSSALCRLISFPSPFIFSGDGFHFVLKSSNDSTQPRHQGTVTPQRFSILFSEYLFSFYMSSGDGFLFVLKSSNDYCPSPALGHLILAHLLSFSL